MLALVGSDGVPGLAAVPDLQVVGGHEGDGVPLVAAPVEVGHGVLAVEGDGLLSR